MDPPRKSGNPFEPEETPYPPPKKKSKMLDYIPGETKKVTGGFYPNQISGVKVMQV